jgi:hypothetical protein
VSQRLLVRVATTPDETPFEREDLRAGRLVVVVVEALDDLERPAALEYVAATTFRHSDAASPACPARARRQALPRTGGQPDR